MSEDCESFKDFEKRRARGLPFRQFCQMLASNLSVEVVPPSGCESSSEDDECWVTGSMDENDKKRSNIEEDRRHSLQHKSVAIFTTTNVRHRLKTSHTLLQKG